MAAHRLGTVSTNPADPRARSWNDTEPGVRSVTSPLGVRQALLAYGSGQLGPCATARKRSPGKLGGLERVAEAHEASERARWVRWVHFGGLGPCWSGSVAKSASGKGKPQRTVTVRRRASEAGGKGTIRERYLSGCSRVGDTRPSGACVLALAFEPKPVAGRNTTPPRCRGKRLASGTRRRTYGTGERGRA